MVNQQTSECVIFDGTTWWGMGADFLYHYPRHPQSRTLNAGNNKSWKHKKKFYLSGSIMFLEHQFQKDFDNKQMNQDENKFITKRS